MTTHSELVAAIDRVMELLFLSPGDTAAEHAHLDTLRAILDLHAPYTSGHYGTQCRQSDGFFGYPCPTIQAVIDALTRMGAL